jgi:hypothetical protein
MEQSRQLAQDSDKSASPRQCSAHVSRLTACISLSVVVVDVFQRSLGKGEVAVAVAAIKALSSVIENSQAATLMGLEIECAACSVVCLHRTLSLNLYVVAGFPVLQTHCGGAIRQAYRSPLVASSSCGA